MNLDDLRGTWQQLPGDSPPRLDPSALTQLLARRPNNPIARMRRNVWLEIGFLALCAGPCCLLFWFAHDSYSRALATWVLAISWLGGAYYQRNLTLLRQMEAATGALTEQLRRQLRALRGLVRLYYRVTMGSLLVTFGLGLFFVGGPIWRDLSGSQLLRNLVVWGGSWVLVGGLAYWAVSRFTRWYLQKLYGQHLDRLEGALHELAEPASPSGLADERARSKPIFPA